MTWAVETITVAQLATVVADLQRRDTEHGGEPEGAIVWVEIGPDDDFDQAMALIELGRPYGLAAARRRIPAETSAAPRR